MSEYDGYVGEAEDEEKPKNQKNRSGDASSQLFVGRSDDQLPEDIRAVWGNDPNAALFIKEWGLQAFRGSKLHEMAVTEHERQQKLGPLRTSYVKNGAAKKK